MAQAFVSNGVGFTVFFGILLLIMETLGNFLLHCMAWYEKFGMDSKKRTISNQLLSKMIHAMMFFNIFFMPLLFGLILIPYSKYFQGFHDLNLKLIVIVIPSKPSGKHIVTQYLFLIFKY